MKPISTGTRTVLFVIIALAAAACAGAVSYMPEDEQLGSMIRLVVFHGASTWVNLATFTLAGLFGVAYLAKQEWAQPWGEALRWVSLPLWSINSVLGLLSMQLIWGGILWREPRLMMTFGVLAGAIVIFGIQLVTDSRKLTAGLDALLAGTLWTLVLVLPNLFHPDSPVFNSPERIYPALFLAQVEHIAIVAATVTVLIARRRQPAEA